jgi:hypothetical protein
MEISTVYLDGQAYDANDIAKRPGRYTAALERAKKIQRHAICGCKREVALRLIIRKLGDYYCLTLWPYEGQLHDKRCIFHRDEIQATVADGLARQSIIEEVDGTVSISPDFDLALNLNQRPITPKPTPTKPGKLRMSRRKASLTALLQFLWNHSRCNVISGFGNAPIFNSTIYKLWLSLGQCIVDKQRLTNVCFMPGMRSAAPNWLAEFEGRLSTSSKAKAVYGVLLGRLTEVAEGDYSYAYSLQGFGKRLYVEKTLHKSFQDSCKLAYAAVQNSPMLNVFVAAQVELTERGYYMVRDCGFIVTSRHFIPVESMYEVEMADALMEAQRGFYKPLKVEDGLLPDFVLTDAPAHIYVEVWGMDTDEYRLRRQEKIEHYAATNRPLIEWDAAAKASMPSLRKEDMTK